MATERTTARMSDTTISLPEDLADELYDRKARGESYADVIRRLLEQADGVDAEETGAQSREAVADPTPDRSPTTTTEADTDPLALVDTVGRDALPGSGAKLDERTEALRAVVEYLQEQGTATPTDFRTEVYPDHQARYTDGENPARSWWKNAMYPALSALAEVTPAVEKADTTGEWSYHGG